MRAVVQQQAEVSPLAFRWEDSVRRLDAASVESLDLQALEAVLAYGKPHVVDLDKAWDGIAWLISEERRDQPYMLPKDPVTKHCVCLDKATRGCTIYEHRPATCRSFDCREDRRIWTDFAARVLAPPPEE